MKMKSLNVFGIILLVVVAFSFAVGDAYTQRRRGLNRMPRYDKSTEVTLKGTVERVESHTGKMGWNGTHFVVRFASETLSVHVGPSAYVAQQGFVFTPGDEIEVTGSRISFEGSEVLIAQKIRKGESLLPLRDEQGFPVWSRGRWRY